MGFFLPAVKKVLNCSPNTFPYFLPQALMSFTKWLLPILVICMGGRTSAQNCISTGLNGSIVNLPCGINCSPLKFKVPHLKSTSDYQVVSIPFTPFSFNAPGGVEPLPAYIDDKFSPAVTMPFSFCFFDSIYSKVVVGSNGIISFDESLSAGSNAYPLVVSSSPQPIPYAGGSPGTITPAYYPKASIMGAYHDIDPSSNANPPGDRKIEYSVNGTAPCRKFIVSFYKVFFN